MKNYVLGFAFYGGHVVLIKKNRPLWQADCWNGVGGLIRPMEFTVDAMVREFFEETGVLVSRDDWKIVGRIDVSTGRNAVVEPVTVYVYMTKLPSHVRPMTMTDEVVGMWVTDMLPTNIIDNVPAMIHLMTCQERDRPTRFVLEYRTEISGEGDDSTVS